MSQKGQFTEFRTGQDEQALSDIEFEYVNSF